MPGAALALLTLAAGCGSPAVAATGPVRVASDGHWTEYDGRKVLLIGDSVTQGWMELGENFDQKAYVDALASRGINLLMIWSYIGITDQVADVRIGYDAPEIWPWELSGTGFDLNRFNATYFDRLRSLVQYAGSRRIVVLITVHDGWTKTRFAGHPFNAARGGPLTDRAQYVELHDPAREMPATFDPSWDRRQRHQYHLERFCDRLIAATSDQPNVMYEMFNEGEWYNQANLRAFQVHFLNFFKARTPRLTLVNDDHVGGADFRGEPNCDVIAQHRPNWSAATTALEAFNYYAGQFAGVPARPFIFDEPVPEYQGDPALYDALMRLMWGTVMAGAGFAVQNDTSYGFDPRSAMAARSGARDAVLDLEKHCARFFNASGIDFGAMAPAGALASSGICLARAGQEYVVYSQDGPSVNLDLTPLAGTGRARFYNPRTGAFSATFEVTGGGSRTIAKPDASDWVLHVTGRTQVLGDLDGDADLDQSDFGLLQACLTGSGKPIVDPACRLASLDGDADVDEDDIAAFRRCARGEGISVEPLCAGPG